MVISTLINIIDNACKFSYNDRVIVNLILSGKNAEITIIDKGIGIAKEDIEMVGEPFYRSSKAREIKGSGIGMTLAQKIIEIHNGEIKLSSELDKGTEVKIIFPVETALKD
ncbi:MAG: sensor histidine kinase [Flavobacteriales bacterium]